MNLHEILVESANAALSLQDSQEGYMPPGHNGSYHDPETSVRTTAHWLITFLKSYDISGKQKFLEAARRSVSYLRSSDVRPMGATFWHRKNPKKDTCNGLIGQAWTIEALSVAAPILEMPELVALAEEVFLLHPHDPSTGLWQCVSVDGTYLDFDYTFNHQLWFAAMGGLLSKLTETGNVSLQVSRFLDCLSNNLRTYPNGLIKHLVSLDLFPVHRRMDDLVDQAWKVRYLKETIKSKQYLKQKEVGYHSFNLYAFALLKQVYRTHPFWKSKAFLMALEYASSEAYRTGVRSSKYGYPYNPPGFEIPFVLSTFYEDADTSKRQSVWVSEQLSKCYDFDSNLMIKNTEDKNTHSARIYEATRLSNLSLSLHL